MEKDIFLRSYNLTEEAFRATGLEWSLLEQIYEQHLVVAKELQSAADYVAGRLQLVPTVHSLKVRIKDAEHLIEKIIRKKSSSLDLSFDCTSYTSLITDLIGIRALHLFKNEWKEIHRFIAETWDLHEEPLAYVREGDTAELIQGFRDAGCRVEEHPHGYRSIHYVLKTQPTRCTRLVEVQVRTIFEEGWSEIDHRVRYPRQSDNPYLAAFLTIFNRLSGAADEMGTFTEQLSAYIRLQAEQAEQSERRIQQKEDELKQAVSQLEISKEEKVKLEKQIADLRLSSLPVISAAGLPGLSSLVVNGSTIAQPDLNINITTMGTQTCAKCKQQFYRWDTASPGLSDQCPSCRTAAMMSGLSSVLRKI
jgi:ppGpp synthetase/RelA/SpoT-type nucleotidyltranferase